MVLLLTITTRAAKMARKTIAIREGPSVRIRVRLYLGLTARTGRDPDASTLNETGVGIARPVAYYLGHGNPASYGQDIPAR